MTFKIETSPFCDLNEPKHWKRNKIRYFFNGAYSNLTLLFTGRKILKYFNDFYN